MYLNVSKKYIDSNIYEYDVIAKDYGVSIAALVEYTKRYDTMPTLSTLSKVTIKMYNRDRLKLITIDRELKIKKIKERIIR